MIRNHYIIEALFLTLLITVTFGDEVKKITREEECSYLNEIFPIENNPEFKSLEELRKNFGTKEYGPDLSKIFPFNSNLDFKVIGCVIYKTGVAIDDDYSYSTFSVAGRRIISKLNYLESEKANALFQEVRSIHHYGDMVGGFKPSFSYEFICGEKTFILNYSPNTKSVNFTSARVSSPLFLETWTTPVLASPKLLKLMEDEINRERSK
jgi:hypothetical protein